MPVAPRMRATIKSRARFPSPSALWQQEHHDCRQREIIGAESRQYCKTSGARKPAGKAPERAEEHRAGALVGGHARSIKSQDLNCGRFITDDLVLDLHPCEAPLTSWSIFRSRHSSCLYGSQGGERIVGSIVPAQDDL